MPTTVKLFFRSIAPISSAIFLLFLSTHAVVAQSKVANFGLKDQNDKYVEVNFPSDRPVVIFFGDRKGSDEIEGWSKPIYQKQQGKAYFFAVASLSGVPSYARGLVRRLIKRKTEFPVLMDWGGKVSESLGYQKEKAMVLIVSQNGQVVERFFGPATESSVNSANAAISRATN